MINPVEEYLQEKQAGFGSSMWQGIKDYAPQAAAVTATSVGTMAAGKAILRGMDNVMLAITKKRDFNAMMEHNPELREYQQEDPKRFNAQFSSLRNLNPTFSKDPIVAGTYMRHMSASPGMAGTAVVQSLSAARGVPQSVFGETAGSMRPPSMSIQSPQQREMDQMKAEQMRAQPGIQSARDDLAERQEERARSKEQRDKELHEAKLDRMRGGMAQGF